MNKVKVGFQHDPIPQKIQKTQVVIDKVKDNPAYPKAQVLLPALQANVDKLSASSQAANSSKATTKELFEVQDADALALDAGLSGLVTDINSEAGGDETKLLSTGLPLAKDSTVAAPIPGAVTEFSLTRAEYPGEVDGHCHKVDYARSYESRFIVGAMPEGAWTPGPTFLKSKFEWTGLKSGDNIWICVRAVGTAGAGPWSNPVSIIVP